MVPAAASSYSWYNMTKKNYICLFYFIYYFDEKYKHTYTRQFTEGATECM